jgi:hypothetical protein
VLHESSVRRDSATTDRPMRSPSGVNVSTGSVSAHLPHRSSEQPINRKSTIQFSTCTTAAHELRNEFPQWRPLHRKACFRARARGGGPQSPNRRVSMWPLRRKARSQFFGLRNASGAARGPVKNGSFPYYNIQSAVPRTVLGSPYKVIRVPS